jgi:hypothetical protein
MADLDCLSSPLAGKMTKDNEHFARGTVNVPQTTTNMFPDQCRRESLCALMFFLVLLVKHCWSNLIGQT